MSKIRYIREDLPRTKNTIHIRGHPLNPVEEIIVKTVNLLVQQANGDKTIPSTAPIKKPKTKVHKMVEEGNRADSEEHNNTIIENT